MAASAAFLKFCDKTLRSRTEGLRAVFQRGGLAGADPAKTEQVTKVTYKVIILHCSNRMPALRSERWRWGGVLLSSDH
jgi:hypothetical protein